MTFATHLAADSSGENPKLHQLPTNENIRVQEEILVLEVSTFAIHQLVPIAYYVQNVIRTMKIATITRSQIVRRIIIRTWWL